MFNNTNAQLQPGVVSLDLPGGANQDMMEDCRDLDKFLLDQKRYEEERK